MEDQNQTKTPEPSAFPSTETDSEKQYTQAELDAAIARERCKQQPENMNNSTKPNGGKSDPRLEQANQRHLLAEAKLAAVSLGVPSKRAGYAAKLADLGNIAIDEETGPDTAAIRKAVETVLRDIPELKAAPQDEAKNGLRIGANNTPVKPGTGTASAATRMKPWNKFRV